MFPTRDSFQQDARVNLTQILKVTILSSIFSNFGFVQKILRLKKIDCYQKPRSHISVLVSLSLDLVFFLFLEEKKSIPNWRQISAGCTCKLNSDFNNFQKNNFKLNIFKKAIALMNPGIFSNYVPLTVYVCWKYLKLKNQLIFITGY